MALVFAGPIARAVASSVSALWGWTNPDLRLRVEVGQRVQGRRCQEPPSERFWPLGRVGWYSDDAASAGPRGVGRVS